LLPAFTGLEWAIRHEQNRTSTPKKAEFLPSLVVPVYRSRDMDLCLRQKANQQVARTSAKRNAGYSPGVAVEATALTRATLACCRA
jgi:hypothetical protein